MKSVTYKSLGTFVDNFDIETVTLKVTDVLQIIVTLSGML